MTQLTTEHFESIVRKFSIADYVVVVISLAICAGIGIYHGFFTGKMTAEKYIMGERKMKLIPTSLSLIATVVSAGTVLGYPTDSYINGIQYIYSSFAVLFVCIILSAAYLPVMHDLQLKTAYEYLELRYGKPVRTLLSIIYLIRTVLFLPSFIYVAALTYSQVTGGNLHYGSLVISLVCVFYTCVGGFKAVVWTDVIQAVTMFASLLLIVIKGVIDVGGLGVIWQKGMESGRIEPPNFSIDPTIRYTALSLTLSQVLVLTQINMFNHEMMQRYLGIADLKTARRALWITNFGRTFYKAILIMLGLVLYAAYYDCDPISTKLVKGRDQVVPLFVMSTTGQYPGLPGVFVAGIFSSALSSLSSSLNAMSAVVLEDFYKRFFSKSLTEKQSAVLMKAVVIILGLIGFGLVFVIENLGTIMEISWTIGSLTVGSSVGIFSMGFFLPWVNTKGALAGGISGFIFLCWIVIGSQIALAGRLFDYDSKPTSVEGCTYDFILPNKTTDISEPKRSDVFVMYRLSYMWNAPLSFLVTVVVGVLVAFITGPNDIRTVDHKLLSPVIRRFLPTRSRQKPAKEANSCELVEEKLIPEDISSEERQKELLPPEEPKLLVAKC